MSEQAALRARITTLKGLQAMRVEMVAEKKRKLDAVVERADREIRNLEARLTIGVAQ